MDKQNTLPLRKRSLATDYSKVDPDESSADSESLSPGSDASRSPISHGYHNGGYPDAPHYPPHYEPKAPLQVKRQKNQDANYGRPARKAALKAKKYVEADDDSGTDEDEQLSDEFDEEEDEPPKRAAPARAAAQQPRSDEPLYCICRKPDHGGFMVGCDYCDEWYHGECVKMSDLRAKQIAKYACPNCEKKGLKIEYFPGYPQQVPAQPGPPHGMQQQAPRPPYQTGLPQQPLPMGVQLPYPSGYPQPGQQLGGYPPQRPPGPPPPPLARPPMPPGAPLSLAPFQQHQMLPHGPPPLMPQPPPVAAPPMMMQQQQAPPPGSMPPSLAQQPPSGPPPAVQPQPPPAAAAPPPVQQQ